MVTKRTININGSSEARLIIDEIVRYVIDDDLYSHEKHFDVNPETGVTEDFVYKVKFPLVTESMRSSLANMLRDANFEIEEDLYGEMQKDTKSVLEKYDLVNNIKKAFLKAFVSADYAIGLEASFSIGSNATQVTLNSFHSSGALKQTEDAIAGIVKISKGTSKPKTSLTTVMFKRGHRPKNYYEVMKNKRRQFTEVDFDYFVKHEEVISLVDLINTGKPVWYDFFEAVYDLDIAETLIEARESVSVDSRDFWSKQNPDANRIKLTKYSLNVDNLYSFQVTPGEIVSKLEEVSSNDFLFVYSPLLKEEVEIIDSVMNPDGTSTEIVTKKKITQCEIHVYLLPDKIKEIKNAEKIEESLLVTNALGVFKRVLIRGIKGISQVIPDSVEISMMIDETSKVLDIEEGSYWNVYFDPIKINLYDVRPQDIVDFLEVCGYHEIYEKGKDPLEIVDTPGQFFITDEENSYKMVVTIFTDGSDPKPSIYQKIEAEKNAYRQAVNEKIEKRNELYRLGKENEAYELNVFSNEVHERISSKNEIVFARTLGADILEVWKVPGVDPYHTYSTHFHEMNEVLSIEGVRNVLGMQFFIASGYGGYIDPRHVLLAIDRMTHTSYIRGFSKEAFAKENYSAFVKSFLSQPAPTMARASGLGEKNMIMHPIEAVMTAGYANFGTTSKATRIEFDQSFDRVIKKRVKERKQYEPEDLKQTNVITSSLINDIVNTSPQVVETETGMETTKGGRIAEHYEPVIRKPITDEDAILRKNISPYLSIYSQEVNNEIEDLIEKETTEFTRFFTPQDPLGVEEVKTVYKYKEPKMEIQEIPGLSDVLDDI